jgi:hypothetical protein
VKTTQQLKAVVAACTLSLGAGALFAQVPLSEAVEAVRPSVVQITLRLGSENAMLLPPDLVPLFNGGVMIAGTGLLINQNGAVLTAAHVALFIQQTAKRLDALGIRVSLVPILMKKICECDGGSKEQVDADSRFPTECD